MTRRRYDLALAALMLAAIIVMAFTLPQVYAEAPPARKGPPRVIRLEQNICVISRDDWASGTYPYRCRIVPALP